MSKNYFILLFPLIGNLAEHGHQGQKCFPSELLRHYPITIQHLELLEKSATTLIFWQMIWFFSLEAFSHASITGVLKLYNVSLSRFFYHPLCLILTGPFLNVNPSLSSVYFLILYPLFSLPGILSSCILYLLDIPPIAGYTCYTSYLFTNIFYHYVILLRILGNFFSLAFQPFYFLILAITF